MYVFCMLRMHNIPICVQFISNGMSKTGRPAAMNKKAKKKRFLLKKKEDTTIHWHQPSEIVKKTEPE